MGSFQPSYFQLLYLITATLLDCKGQTERPCMQAHELNINYVQGDYMSISCLTTTHPLESLTVKLRRTDQVKDILMYSDTNPTSEYQRWSVRKEAGNVTLHLKDISLSDQGRYECQVYKDGDCLNATLFNLRVKECKTLEAVRSTPKMSVLLPCSEHPLQNRTDLRAWRIITGHQSTAITDYHTPHKPSNSTQNIQKPLYERVRILVNGSLLIRDVVNADGLWYRCRINEITCYEVNLVVKDSGTSRSTAKMETLSTTFPICHKTGCPVVQTEGNIETSGALTTNLTAVVMVSIVSLCVLISLIICVILYFKKRSKINSKTKLNYRVSAYYSPISEAGFDVPLYSLVEHNTETMTTFCAEETRASAYEPDGMYEI